MKTAGLGIFGSSALICLHLFGMERAFLVKASRVEAAAGGVRHRRSSEPVAIGMGLPVWTEGPTTIQTAFAAGRDASVSTELLGADLKSEYTWEKGRWTFDVGGALESGPVAVEEGFVAPGFRGRVCCPDGFPKGHGTPRRPGG